MHPGSVPARAGKRQRLTAKIFLYSPQGVIQEGFVLQSQLPDTACIGGDAEACNLTAAAQYKQTPVPADSSRVEALCGINAVYRAAALQGQQGFGFGGIGGDGGRGGQRQLMS